MRVGLRKTLVTLAELPFSVWTASRMLDRDRPAAVFSMGGFVAGPVLLAALWKRVPVVVMEPNAIPGFTHRKLARFVSRALVSFPETAQVVSGSRDRSDRDAGARRVLCDPAQASRRQPLTVLITGGSQGSRTLNRAAQESWPLWGSTAVRLIHQTGPSGVRRAGAGVPEVRDRGRDSRVSPRYAGGVRLRGCSGEPRRA